MVLFQLHIFVNNVANFAMCIVFCKKWCSNYTIYNFTER